MQQGAIQLFELLRAHKKELFITIADKDKLLTKPDAITIFATKEDIANAKTQIITTLLKWLVGFMLPLYLALIGILITIIKMLPIH